jgi:hypothetical protein
VKKLNRRLTVKETVRVLNRRIAIMIMISDRKKIKITKDPKTEEETASTTR